MEINKNFGIFPWDKEGAVPYFMNEKNNEVIYENQSLEGVACWLDVYKATKDWDNV